MIPERLVTLGVLAGLVIVPLWAHLAGEPFTVTLATRAVILGLAATGLHLALGQGGLVSLGHAAFFGIGGYAAAIPSWHAQTYAPLMGLETTAMPVLWLWALAASALAAAVIGALSLRTQGVYFIMATLAFGQMLFFFAVGWARYGGEDGLPIYVRNGFPGLNTLQPIQFYALCLALLLLALGLSHVLARSPFGLALRVARQSEARAEAAGHAPTRLRLTAFAISGAMTGLAGALFADLNRFVSPAMLSWQVSGELIVFCVLGGLGRLIGPVVGAVLFVVLEHWLGGVWDHWPLLLGALLLGIVLFARGGVVGWLAK